MLAMIFGQPYPTACAALAAEHGLGAAAVAQLVELVEDQVIGAAAVIAASLARAAAGEEDAGAAGGSGIEGLLAQAAQQLAATREFSDQDLAEAASLMAGQSRISAHLRSRYGCSDSSSRPASRIAPASSEEK